MQLGNIMAGSVVIESIFGITGIGTLMVTGINNKNYPVVLGCVIFLSMAVCVINLLVDIVYSFVDPRIKAQLTGGKPRGSRRSTLRKEAA